MNITSLLYFKKKYGYYVFSEELQLNYVAFLKTGAMLFQNWINHWTQAYKISFK